MICNASVHEREDGHKPTDDRACDSGSRSDAVIPRNNGRDDLGHVFQQNPSGGRRFASDRKEDDGNVWSQQARRCDHIPSFAAISTLRGELRLDSTP
jgi:hypothetical protein